MIEEEAQEIQIVGSQLFAQEEVVSQSAVEILDDRTGSHGVVDNLCGCFLDGLKEGARALLEWVFLRFTARLIQGLGFKELPHEKRIGVKFLRQVQQLLVEFLREGEKLLSSVFEPAPYGGDAMGELIFPSAQSLDDPVIQSLARGEVGADDGEDVFPHPA